MAMDDLDAKVRAFLLDAQSEESAVHHTFAQRAESYYQKRPHLLSLLHHLHSAYLYLLLTSHRLHHHHNKHDGAPTTAHLVDGDNSTLVITSPSSDGAESTLSGSISSSSFTSRYKPSLRDGEHDYHDPLVMDAMVAEIVMKGVKCNIVSHELGLSWTKAESFARRCELQGSLVELLESERLVLTGENARLRARVAALVEDGEAVGLEVAFLRRRVAELVANLTRVKREEVRIVVVLNRRIEDLRRKIYGLERWNNRRVVMVEGKEREVDRGGRSNLCSNCGERSAVLGGSCGRGGGGRLGEKVASWWERVKDLDFLLCGSYHSNSSKC